MKERTDEQKANVSRYVLPPPHLFDEKGGSVMPPSHQGGITVQLEPGEARVGQIADSLAEKIKRKMT